MGHKKRKPSENQQLQITVSDQTLTTTTETSSVKSECERALTALRRGNHTRALRLMKDLLSKHENTPNSALIHRVHGTVSVKVASIIDDPTAKQRHLKTALDSAKRASVLSPDSVEFAHFYANLLYESSSEGKEFEEVVHECERALGIENPVDPGKESLQEVKVGNEESRVLGVQNELRALIQKSNIASLSSWMKTLGTGEEKFRLIPIRRAAEDPMELRLVNTRRPNEIKKACKTPEERRKEIEVRVAAARLLQQKSETWGNGGGGDTENLTTRDRKGVETGLGTRRRNARKNVSSDERRVWVQSYWNSMSEDRKKEFVRVRVSEFREHFVKDVIASEVVNQALVFGETNKVWKFWGCCRCSEKFSEADSFMQHVVHEHMGSLLPKMQTVLPLNVEKEWAEMILTCGWKPLDVNAAMKILEKETKSEASEFFDASYQRIDGDDSKECFVDTYCNEYEWDSSSPGRKKSGTYCNGGGTHDSREFDDVEWMECNGDQTNKEILFHDNWPLADDPERVKLLERIHAVFQTLIKNKCLASSHLSKVIHFAVDELQGLACGSQLFNSNLDQTPLCICFLGASELRKILKFLQEIAQSCGLSRYSNQNNALEDSNNDAQCVEIMEKIVFSEDASFLVLDEHFLPRKIIQPLGFGAVNGDSGQESSSNLSYPSGVVLDSDALLSWIFIGPSSGEQLAAWTRTREEKAQQGLEILQLLEKESFHLQGLCERKCEHLSYEEALQAVEDLCLEEGKKREHETDFVRQSYETVLRKRREELIENDNEINVISKRFESDAITNVLKDSESLNVNQFGFEETYNGVTSHLCDLESGEDDWRTKDYLHQVDSCIEVAIQRQKEHVSVEVSKIDAKIMRMVTGMQQLDVKLESSSCHDFRMILIPFLKSFLRSCLEELAEKDATEKSDAAREAFLAELDQDSKKGGGSGGDRIKDKKRSKDNRKNKDPKVTNGGDSHDQAAEELLIPSYHNEEVSSSEIDFSGADDDALRLHEEEEKHRMELEAEERKLQETLEYQRRIENEAKLKHLAEQQHKRISIATGEKAEETLATSDVFSTLEHDDDDDDDDKDAMEQWVNGKDGLDINLEESGKQIANGVMPNIGLTNGGTPQDGGLFSDRRSGRRGRRHKGPTKLIDGSFLPVTLGKQENGADQPTLGQNSLGNGDNGAKTLRQLKAEEDDEERFQADLKKAVLQSLDTFQVRQKSPLLSTSAMSRMDSQHTNDSYVSCDSVVGDDNEMDAYGMGLKNEVGEYNCFLNVIIQSLWHLRRFRDEFLQRKSSDHIHVGDPCVVCALFDIFMALSTSSTNNNRREAIAPTTLRVALSNLYPDSNFFQEGQMNDASEVLGVIFNCLHRSFTHEPSVPVAGPVDNNCRGSWDCTNGSCIAHTIFGMDVFERMNCYNCGLESRHLKYTSFFHNINASALRTMKVTSSDSSFDELLNLVEMNHQLACDTEAGGCGKLNYIHHILSTPPHVFTTVLGWQNTRESVENITATLGALSTDIDIGVLYRGLDPQNRHRLVSVVCYYGQHYHCFAYSRDHEQWVMYDDKTVKVIGSWSDVLLMCEKGHLQPQVLLFEAVH